MELDGAQHLVDPVPYRRDRRKDLLLQETATACCSSSREDVGKELDLVLDTIVRALSHHQSAMKTVPLNFVRRDRE